MASSTCNNTKLHANIAFKIMKLDGNIPVGGLPIHMQFSLFITQLTILM